MPIYYLTLVPGDPVATAIIDGAIAGLASDVAELRRRTPCPRGAATVITGGVAVGCPAFADSLHAALTDACGEHPVQVRPDVTGAALRLAERGRPCGAEGETHWTVSLHSPTSTGGDHEHRR